MEAEVLACPLSKDHPFEWTRVMKTPKANYGSFTLNDDPYKTLTYELSEADGFLRLCTLRAKTYWEVHDQQTHTTPDWKLHFSIDPLDIPQAWNIVAATFMQLKCEVGMTVVSRHDDGMFPPAQFGRELTVYIFKYDREYNAGDGIAMFESPYTSFFWLKFIRSMESRLSGALIRNHGIAYGDLPLPACRYTSLRNEAYIPTSDDGAKSSAGIPPNSAGWNAAQHRNPLCETIDMLTYIDAVYFI